MYILVLLWSHWLALWLSESVFVSYTLFQYLSPLLSLSLSVSLWLPHCLSLSWTLILSFSLSLPLTLPQFAHTRRLQSLTCWLFPVSSQTPRTLSGTREIWEQEKSEELNVCHARYWIKFMCDLSTYTELAKLTTSLETFIVQTLEAMANQARLEGVKALLLRARVCVYGKIVSAAWDPVVDLSADCARNCCNSSTSVSTRKCWPSIHSTVALKDLPPPSKICLTLLFYCLCMNINYKMY